MTEETGTGFDKRHRFAKGNKIGSRFQPGETGNPNGSPPASTHLWRFFCMYMQMTDLQFEKLKARKLRQNQQAAVALVEAMREGKYIGSSKFTKYVVNRELGKPVEHLQVSGTEPLSSDECEAIRGILRKNGSVD